MDLHSMKVVKYCWDVIHSVSSEQFNLIQSNMVEKIKDQTTKMNEQYFFEISEHCWFG